MRGEQSSGSRMVLICGGGENGGGGGDGGFDVGGGLGGGGKWGGKGGRGGEAAASILRSMSNPGPDEFGSQNEAKVMLYARPASPLIS